MGIGSQIHSINVKEQAETNKKSHIAKYGFSKLLEIHPSNKWKTRIKIAYSDSWVFKTVQSRNMTAVEMHQRHAQSHRRTRGEARRYTLPKSKIKKTVFRTSWASIDKLRSVFYSNQHSSFTLLACPWKHEKISKYGGPRKQFEKDKYKSRLVKNS